VLIVDNMLWSGRVFEQGDNTPETASIRKLTELLTRSPDWIVSLAPVRDGVVGHTGSDLAAGKKFKRTCACGIVQAKATKEHYGKEKKIFLVLLVLPCCTSC